MDAKPEPLTPGATHVRTCSLTHATHNTWQLGIYASRPARASTARSSGGEGDGVGGGGGGGGGGATSRELEQIEFLSASEYVFSYERMKRNCNRLRIGAIRSRKKTDAGFAQPFALQGQD